MKKAEVNQIWESTIKNQFVKITKVNEKTIDFYELKKPFNRERNINKKAFFNFFVLVCEDMPIHHSVLDMKELDKKFNEILKNISDEDIDNFFKQYLKT